jgi:hypothetical protein
MKRYRSGRLLRPSRQISVPSAAVGATSLVPVVEGLDGPRGVAVGPAGRVVYAENDGSFSQLVTKGEGAGSVTQLGTVPKQFIAPAVAVGGRGQTFVLTAGPPPGVPPSPGVGTLYRWTPGAKGVRVVADIAAYQQTDPDPYNLADPPRSPTPSASPTCPTAVPWCRTRPATTCCGSTPTVTWSPWRV